MKNKKNKKRIIKLSVPIFIVLLFICIFAYKALLYPSLKNDTDENFYISSQGKMIYSSDSFAIENTDDETFDLCSDSGKKKYKCNSVLKYNDYIIYSNDEGLFIEDSADDTKKVFDSCPDMVYPYKENIYILNRTNNLYIYNLTADKLESKAFDCGDVEWIGINEGKLYIKCVSHEEEGSINGVKVTFGRGTFTFLQLNIDTLEQENSFSLTTENAHETITPLLSGGKLIYALDLNSEGDSEVYYVDFLNNKSEFLFKHYIINNIVSNDKCIYFSSEVTKSVPFWITDDAFKSTNGLWKYDINKGEKEKISDDCVYEDLLVTNNFLYCNKTLYIFPRLTFDYINFGYSVKQIALTDIQ